MDKITIATPEQIELEYELAGLGSRFIAVLVDHVIQGTIFLILYFVAILSYKDIYSNNPEAIFTSTFVAILGVLIFLVTFGYFVFFESIWAGLTPGKKLSQIQVVKDNGEPITFIDSLLRNLFRIIDFLPSSYIIGVISILFHKKNKRIGDIIANTIVIKVKSSLTPNALPEIKVKSDYDINISGLTEIDYDRARKFITRRNELPADHRSRIGAKLAAQLMRKMNTAENITDNEEFIELVATEYRNRKKML